MPRIVLEWLGYCNRIEIERKTGEKKHPNKWWAACIREEDDGTYSFHTLFAGLMRVGTERITRFTKGGIPLTLSDATALFHREVKGKQLPSEGYEPRQFGVPFGTPKQIIVPSFAQRFTTASLPTQAGQRSVRVPTLTTAPSGAISCLHCQTTIPAHEAYCVNCGMAVSSMPPSASLTPSVSQPPQDALPAANPILAVGTELKQGRYSIVEKVGAGGMGAVYKARDQDLAHRLVAVKEVIPDPGLSAEKQREAQEAFKQEALLLATLTHSSLPRIYDHFTEAGRSYLVMDFLAGNTLERLLEEAPNSLLPVVRVLSIGIALCDVLDYLHTQHPPIIFRDLKPANVMITPREEVYLIDFGIARAFKLGQQKDTTALGSPGYAAPEQYGKSQSTPATDLYGLGATLHEALTGVDPSANPFFFQPFPSWLSLHTQLEALVLAMVQLDPMKRPASAAHVKVELQRISSLYATFP